MRRALDRRRFLQQTAAEAGAALVSAAGLRAASRALQEPPALEPLRLAFFGAGGRGWGDLQALLDHEFVALCDVDAERSRQARERCPEARFFLDYRECLDAVGGELEAVVVSTPDPLHAPIAMEAMRRGLHCYCEKPLTWSVEEARAMRALAREKGLVTQMGNGGSASDGLRAGVLGAVSAVYV